MEPISLILLALAAGAGQGVVKGVGEAATSAVKDAYAGLRDAVKRRLADKPAAEYAVEQYTGDPQAWKTNVETELRAAGADRDEVILKLARAVMEQVDPAGASAAKYMVTVTGGQGVQVGDRNTQTNYFGSRAPRDPGDGG